MVFGLTRPGTEPESTASVADAFVSCLYGSTVCCKYRKSTFNRLRVGHNNAYRTLFNLPRRSSMSTTLVQNNVPTFHALIRKHTASFILRCINSCNVWLSALVRSSNLSGSYNNHFCELAPEYLAWTIY